MLTDMFTDKMEYYELQEVYCSLPGPASMQKAACTKVNALVRGIINPMVIAQWKAMNGAISASEIKVKAAIEKGMAPVVQAKANTVEAVKDKVDDKITPVREKVIEPLANVLATKAQPSLAQAFAAALRVVEEHMRIYVDERKTGVEATAAATSLDKAVASRTKLKEAFTLLDNAKETLCNSADAVPDQVRDKVSFAKVNCVPWAEAAETTVYTLLSNAAYTLQQALTEADPTSDSDGALAETLAKAKADAQTETVATLTRLVATFLEPVFKSLVVDVCDPLVTPIDEHIPEAAQEFITAGSCLSDILDSIVDEAASQAAEASV